MKYYKNRRSKEYYRIYPDGTWAWWHCPEPYSILKDHFFNEWYEETTQFNYGTWPIKEISEKQLKAELFAGAL